MGKDNGAKTRFVEPMDLRTKKFLPLSVVVVWGGRWEKEPCVCEFGLLMGGFSLFVDFCNPREKGNFACIALE